MSSSSNTPPDEGFNDLSRPLDDVSQDQRTASDGVANGAPQGADAIPKPKRIACIICRRRKLKCDGIKPSCSTCTRLSHNCSYDETRKKSGPKRGYVKALEERLKQVENMLNTQEAPPQSAENGFVRNTTNSSGGSFSRPNVDLEVPNPSVGIASDRDRDRWTFPRESPQPIMDDITFSNTMNMGIDMNMNDSAFAWEMIGLGLEEPLPPQESIDELHQIYFEKIHPSLPMIHKFRYLAAMNLAPNQRPPVTLRYAMWTLAASVSEKYMNLREHFYQRSRKYIEMDYMKGHGENMISIAHAQTHILLASFEFKMMYFPRAWMSTGSAARLCQMMGLHRLDGAGLEVKQCLPPPRDWTEREERRRTFWMAFCEDRYASIGTGWPMAIEEKDISTDLPASEEAFEMSKPERTQSLPDTMTPSGASNISPFGGVVLMACLFGRNLVHLHRPDADDRDHDLDGEFWKRHRHMDNILLNTSLSLPSHLKLPNGISSPNIVFVNMNIHTSTICLHQAAIYKASKNRLPASISAESKVRCISAANEIASIMRMISHMDLSSMNPFICFCLYVAARVFVQYLKTRPDDSRTADSLRFLLTAMNALKKKNSLTESFLVQLDVDLEGLGMRHPITVQSSQFIVILGNEEKRGHKPTPMPPQENFPSTKDTMPTYGYHLHPENLSADPACDVGEAMFPPPDNTNSTSTNTAPNSTRNSRSEPARQENCCFPAPEFGPVSSWMPGDTIATRDPNVIPVALQGIIAGQGTGPEFDLTHSYNSHMSGYGPSETLDAGGSDVNMAGGATLEVNGTNQPTPNSGASETRPGQAGNGNGNASGNGLNSYETSSDGNDDGAAVAAFLHADYGAGGTGLTPDESVLLQTPNSSTWQMGNTGMTPGTEAFQQMMGMDVGWSTHG